jgi:glucuronoarabinoxylan endo-1,4-beta-xylanase
MTTIINRSWNCRSAFILILSLTITGIAYGANTCTINQAATRQTIRGFGGSSAWHGYLTDSECDTLFGTLGLSILRVQIDANGFWDPEIANAQKAQARGAIVFASPWSPPAYMKDNQSTVGGSLLPQYYDDYVVWLNTFASNIPGLYALSVQNEPNISVTYDSCSWTEQQLFDFIVNHGAGFNTRLMMPETFNFARFYADSILANPIGAANTDICAYHWYGANRNGLWTEAYNLGKDIWMTEHFSDDQTITGALDTAVEIHKQLTINFANAYVWWFLRQPSCNLIEPGGSSIHIRGYVMAQYAKFVRNGSVRVDATGGATGTYHSAFVNAGKLVIVSINTSSQIRNQTFTISNGNAASVSSYTTSNTKGLQQGATYTVTGGSFTGTLDPKSVTTFVQN